MTFSVGSSPCADRHRHGEPNGGAGRLWERGSGPGAWRGIGLLNGRSRCALACRPSSCPWAGCCRRGAVLYYNGAVQVRFDPEPIFTSLFAGSLLG